MLYGAGELRIQLCSAKPVMLEAAITLVSELELIRDLEHSQMGAADAKIRGVSDTTQDSQITILLQRRHQKVRTLKVSVDKLSAS